MPLPQGQQEPVQSIITSFAVIVPCNGSLTIHLLIHVSTTCELTALMPKTRMQQEAGLKQNFLDVDKV